MFFDPGSDVLNFKTYGADAIAFLTDGDERMRITAAGRVQVGSAVGNAYFDVSAPAGSQPVLYWKEGGAGRASMFYDPAGSELNFKTYGSDAITFVTNNSDRMTVLGSGNVGIGTPTPSQELDVDGDIALSGYVYKGSNRFLHNYGTYNTFVGINAGNFALSGAQDNTGIGRGALSALTDGDENAAIGAWALLGNTTGRWNTALGCRALNKNTTGVSNTAVGTNAAKEVVSGNYNTVVGVDVLDASTTGSMNVAVGTSALGNATGDDNTAIGYMTLNGLTSGTKNIALGMDAGQNLSQGSYNIYIGSDGPAAWGPEGNAIRIGNDTYHWSTYIAAIHGNTVAGGTAVYVKSDGELGTVTSSARFKTGIADMGSSSGVLYNLRPVTFEYKPEIDPAGIPQYGLIAEEVAEVAPDLVIYDDAGDPYTVRYEQLVPMLLNELQAKDTEIHRVREELEELRRLVETLL